MARHASPVVTKTGIRNIVIAMAALTAFVIAMIASYSGAFAKPTLHHLTVAVAAPEQVVDAVRSQEALDVNVVGGDAQARQQVRERQADTAFVVDPTGGMKIYVAGGGGRSVAAAAETVGHEVAAKGGLRATVEDVAPDVGGGPVGHRRVLRHHLHLDRSVPGRHRLRISHGQGAQACHHRVAHHDVDGVLGASGRRGDGLRRRRARRVDRTRLAGVRRAVAVCDGCRRRRDRRRGGVRNGRVGAADALPGGRRQRGCGRTRRKAAAVAASTRPSR